MTQAGDGEDELAMIELPDKTYFKIGEVAKLLEVEPYVLRYWETEFEVLAPEKTKSGQRVYQRDDIELLLQIRSLLYEEMFTIAGARRQLARNREGKPSYFDLKEDRGRGQGTAMADEDGLRQELESTRRTLAAAETELAEMEEALTEAREEMSLQERELEEVRREAAQLRQENAAATKELAQVRHQLETASSAADPERVSKLEQQIAELERELETARTEADTQRRALQRSIRDRQEHRRELLGALREEVQELATLAEPSAGSRIATR